MQKIKYIFLFLGFLLLFVSTNSKAITTTVYDKENCSNRQTTTTEPRTTIPGSSLLEQEGILQPSIRSAQSNITVFQNFKGGKKNAANSLLFIPFNHSTTVYPYFAGGLHNFTSHPLYIAYRRLII